MDSRNLLRVKRSRMKRRTSFIEDRERSSYRKILMKFSKPHNGKELIFHNCFQQHGYERELVFAMHSQYEALSSKNVRRANADTNLYAVVESKTTEIEFWKKKYYDSMKLIQPLHKKHRELVDIIRGRDVNMKNIFNVNRQKEMEILEDSNHLENQIQLLNDELHDAQSEIIRNQKVERENKTLQRKVEQLNLKGKKVEELQQYVKTYKDLADQFEQKTHRLNDQVNDLGSQIELGDLQRKKMEDRWKEEKEELQKVVVQAEAKDKEIKKTRKRIRKLTDELRKAQNDTRVFKDKLRKIQEDEKRRMRDNSNPMMNNMPGQTREALKYSNISFKINNHNKVEVNKNIYTMGSSSGNKDSSEKLISKSIQTNPTIEINPGKGNNSVSSQNQQQTINELERQVENLKKQLIMFQKQESFLKGSTNNNNNSNSTKTSNFVKNHLNRGNHHRSNNNYSSNSPHSNHNHNNNNKKKFRFGSHLNNNNNNNNSSNSNNSILYGGSVSCNTPPAAKFVSRQVFGNFLGKKNGNNKRGGKGGYGGNGGNSSSMPQNYIRSRLANMNFSSKKQPRGGNRFIALN